MPIQVAPPYKSGSWPISVGANGIAAAQFARCGFDVMTQSGPDKPWYDLVVTRGGNLLKIGVKASDNGRWRLAESYLVRAAHANSKKPDIQHAIRMWLDIHGERTIYCLVQFEGVSLNELPRIYLATPAEIARRMRETAERTGEPLLYESYDWSSPESGFTSIEALPSSWLFSHVRIEELIYPSAVHEMAAARPIGVRPEATAINRAGLREAAMTA